jgi:hypothetical protein
MGPAVNKESVTLKEKNNIKLEQITNPSDIYLYNLYNYSLLFSLAFKHFGGLPVLLCRINLLLLSFKFYQIS